MLCPYDNSADVIRYGFRAGNRLWFCKSCNRKFSEKPSLFGMRYPTRRITEALTYYYNGMSYRNMSSTFDDLHGRPIPKMTLWRWVMAFSYLVANWAQTLRPQLGRVWIADETVIRIFDQNWWFWDIIDERTRYLIATHLSRTRGSAKAKSVFRQARKVSDVVPRVIRTDKLKDYESAIRSAFQSVYGAKPAHLTSEGFMSPTNINLIERFHGTIKQRTKVMRAFKRPVWASIGLDGYVVHYNFLQEHSHLDMTPPAVVAGIGGGIKNWGDLIRLAAPDDGNRRRTIMPVRQNSPNVAIGDWSPMPIRRRARSRKKEQTYGKGERSEISTS